MQGGTTDQTDGQVLRIKQGYNPNSSSVGSAIPVFLAGAVGAGAVAAFLLNLVGSVRGVVRAHKPAAHDTKTRAQDAGDDEAPDV